jgi:hypothetical protein
MISEDPRVGCAHLQMFFYHRPTPKRSIILSYTFAKPPSQTIEESSKEGVDTAIFYDNPSLPPLATAMLINKTAIESTKPVHIKMNLKGKDGMLDPAKDAGVFNLGSYGKRRVKLDLVIALKTHF